MQISQGEVPPPPQTSDVVSEPQSPETVFVVVRKKINNYASTHCISWW